MKNCNLTYNDLENRIAQLEKELHEKDIILQNYISPHKSAAFNRSASHHMSGDVAFSKYKDKAQEIYRIIVENAREGIVMTDLSGNCTYLNSQFANMLGYTTQDILNQNMTRFANDEYVSEMIEIRNRLRYNKLIQGEFKFKRKDGSDLITLFNAKSVYDAQGKHVANLGIHTDITQGKKIECELTITKEKAEESNLLKTAFLQNMSHEIRTPLNAISGFAELLNSFEFSEEECKNFMHIIQENADQLIAIITDIMTISSIETKQEKINLSKFRVNDLIDELSAMFHQEAVKQKITLVAKQSVKNKQLEVFSDKSKIIQILSYLLTNSLKFTPKGSVEFGYNNVNNELIFYVKDNGIGIHPEAHQKIFQRFIKASNSIKELYGGTGLGLAIAKELVGLLGGKIWVESEVEKGSVFFFTIPYKPVFNIRASHKTSKCCEL
nr:PAS domain-containing sensor histidine kinase [uncultured Carboxylicivirga sp.]